MAFAAGWTSCVGPILSSILVYASSMDTISKGIFLLVFYSLGHAVPFILTALAIDFKLKDLNGKEATLSDYKWKKIFLNFWASWCPPCKAEMTEIDIK